MQNNPFISVINLNKFAGKGENQVHILKDINLEIAHGEFVAIIGQSGSGKSTLMNILGCLDKPTSGSYQIDGVESTGLDANSLATLRSRTLGFVFQRYNLISSLNALENVMLPAVYAGMPYEKRLALATSLFSELGLADRMRGKPNELSGGQQQRVSIARALINGGELILADEPTGALDSQNGKMVIETLKKLNTLGHTIIMVTHNPEIAKHASRIIEIQDGAIVFESKNIELQTSIELAPAVNFKKSTFANLISQFVEACKMSVQAVYAHKMRSMLTMLGVIIGIAAVVSVVALGRGSQEKILNDIKAMGTNTIEIFPGEGFGDRFSWRVTSLSVEDAKVLSSQPYIAGASPTATLAATGIYKEISVNVYLYGVNEQYLAIKGMEIESGRFLTTNDTKNDTSVAVIDYKTRNSMFKEGENPVGKIIILEKRPFEIVGVIKKQENHFGRRETPEIFLPYSSMVYKLTGDHDLYSIIVKVSDNISTQLAEKNLTALLMARHEGKKDFFAFNTDSIKQVVEGTTNTMTLLISGIALISLVVGGIGVMNIMLVSVTERTAEIGVRMAIGAQRHNILMQFLVEAVIICLIGGLLGVGLSLTMRPLFNLFTQEFVLSYSFESIIIALCCSTFTGILFGFMPARNASLLNPVDALNRD